MGSVVCTQTWAQEGTSQGEVGGAHGVRRWLRDWCMVSALGLWIQFAPWAMWCVGDRVSLPEVAGSQFSVSSVEQDQQAPSVGGWRGPLEVLPEIR